MRLVRTTLFEIPAEEQAGISDADTTPRGEPLVLLRRPDGSRECLYPRLGRVLPLPPQTDFIRAMPWDRLLLVSTRSNRGNGRVLAPDGSEQAVFDLDAPICDVLVDWSDGAFWVSYFRMGVPAGLSGEGLVRFDPDGKPTVRFRSDFSGPESGGETHPFFLAEPHTIWLFPEPESRLLEIDWTRWAIRSRRVPWVCQEADAICVRGSTAYFAGTRQHVGGVMAMGLDGSDAVDVGSIRGRPRPASAPEGVFLDIQRRSVALLSAPRPAESRPTLRRRHGRTGTRSGGTA
jgi:hypothetical protein